MIAFILFILFVLSAVALYWVYTDKKYYKDKTEILESLIENLNKQIDNHKEWHDLTRVRAARAMLSESCLIKTLEDYTNNADGKGVAYANRWLSKREEILQQLTNECESLGNRNLEEVYESSSRISQMILQGELDINRD